MRRISLFLLNGAVLLAVILAAQPGAAQDSARTGDANRDRMLTALGKGDMAGAEKLLAELQASASAKAAQGNTAFEEITGCGFYPQETRLECILNIKQRFGYSGPPTGLASYEFVTFCADWDCNGSYSANEAAGLGIVHMHDEADGAAPAWQYAVYRDLAPPGSLSDQCFMRTGPGGNPVMTKTRTKTINARAILSWSAPVAGCNSVPVWGNVVNFRIRLDPIR